MPPSRHLSPVFVSVSLVLLQCSTGVARAATDAELEKMVPWGAIQIAGWQVIMRMVFHNGMHTGQIADQLCLIRSLQTDAVNHAPAARFFPNRS